MVAILDAPRVALELALLVSSAKAPVTLVLLSDLEHFLPRFGPQHAGIPGGKEKVSAMTGLRRRSIVRSNSHFGLGDGAARFMLCITTICHLSWFFVMVKFNSP